ncbi:hypothetical protein VNO78_08110 [Psophocarpus tetragonolobus]|uniref:Integrase catalytic domain-containing protein n=1 Tax=Psophocarpus tetragonolobus TaxID=3891 RepID=A0AAN9SUE5_PSOTE
MSFLPFSLVHIDVWGPAYVPNISGAKWFLTFIDDYTRVTWVFLLKQKSEISSVFIQFVSMIKNQFAVSIKRIRSDNAKDYFNLVLNSFCQRERIIHESSCVNTPQQNGIAERKNGHILDQTRALLFQNHVPKRFWEEALLTATYLINSNERGKLDPRAVKCVFLGYSTTQKGYKYFQPLSKRFYVSRDVTFNEQESYFKQPHLQGETVREEDETLMFPNMMFGLEIVPETEGSIEHSAPEPPEPVRPPTSAPEPTKQLAPAPDAGGKFSRREKVIPGSGNVQESNPPSLHEVTPSNPINLSDSNELLSENIEAQVDQNLDLPIALIKGTRTCTQQPRYPLSNFLSFEKFSPTHKTFLTNLNSTHTPSSVSEALTDRKWKHAMDVEMEALHKNRTWELVILPPGKKPVGCKWVYTIKYRADGTIEHHKARLVAKSFTQTYGVDYLETFAPDLQEFDVKNAFLHGDLEEEIYMELPPGYHGHVAVGTVCKLRKALYGLKQSPRAWFGRFTKVMTDDIIVSGDDKQEQQVLSECLATEFEIKTLGRLKYFLGIEVAHSKKGIFISQQKPDIAFAVSLVSQFMHQPKKAHLQAALRIVQYLKGTPGRGILFKRNKSVSLEAYTDADYVLKIILENLKIKWDEPMRLYCDKKSVISIAHNPVQHDRTKHIEVDRHFIKEKLDSGMICTPYVSTQNQLTDILTKGLNCKWMYPIERYMKILKGYTHNQYHPEAFVVERYVAEEVIKFCSEYMEKVKAIGVLESRHDNKWGGKGTRGLIVVTMTLEQLKPAHLYILNNTDEVAPYIIADKDFVKVANTKLSQKGLINKHNKKFLTWFKDTIFNDLNSSKTLKWLANGPNLNVITWKGYDINKYLFYTKSQDDNNELRFTLVDLKKVGYKDEPFIMEEQAKQMFYVEDPSNSWWSVVLQGRANGVCHEKDEATLDICDNVPFSTCMHSFIEENKVNNVYANRIDHDEGHEYIKLPFS